MLLADLTTSFADVAPAGAAVTGATTTVATLATSFAATGA